MKVFLEEQKFTQPLVIIGLSVAFIVTGSSIIINWESFLTGSIGEKFGTIIGLLIVLLIGLLFTILKLKTRVDEKGIQYQFSPFQSTYKIIKWENLSKCSIRKYNALLEYGGWGIKFSFSKKRGKAFTTKGSIGLQLELIDGSKLLIGTQKEEELQRVINTYLNIQVNEII